MAAIQRKKQILANSENVLQPTRLQGVKRLGIANQPTKMQAKPRTMVTRAVLKNADVNPKVTGLTGKVKTMKLLTKKPTKVKPLLVEPEAVPSIMDEVVKMEVDEMSEDCTHFDALAAGKDLIQVKVFPPGVSNVDTDFTDPQTCTDYVRDIYVYLRNLERTQAVKENFLAGSTITPKMRAVLINWLIEVKDQFRFMQETIYLTVALIDRYLSATALRFKRNKLQLLGISCLYLAIKYEETQIPEIDDFVYISDQSCKAPDIRSMEQEILKTLNYNLGRPLSINFLRRNSKVANVSAYHHGLGKLILESVMLECSFSAVDPSKIAAAALLLSIVVIDEKTFDEAWTPNLAFYSGYEVKTLIPLAKKLGPMLLGLKDSKFPVIYQKYQKLYGSLIYKFEKEYRKHLEIICLADD